MRERFHIRPAFVQDVPACPEIERTAALLFKTFAADLGIPEEMFDQPDGTEAFAAAQARGQLWVADEDGVPVGFALVNDVAGFAHLEELDVLPSHGRQGIGTALLRSVCEWSWRNGKPAVTLRTFRDVPWNAPFYQRQGFGVVESATLSDEHVALEHAESARGLRTDNRVTMIWRSPHIRDFRRGDQVRLEAFFLAAWGPDRFQPDSASGDLRRIPEGYQTNGGGFWLLWAGQDIVGTVALRRLLDNVVELKRWAVSPDHRGRGLGTRLFEHAVERAKATGFGTMRLDSVRSPGPALHTFSRFGFEEIGRYNDNPIADIFMELRLR